MTLKDVEKRVADICETHTRGNHFVAGIQSRQLLADIHREFADAKVEAAKPDNNTATIPFTPADMGPTGDDHEVYDGPDGPPEFVGRLCAVLDFLSDGEFVYAAAELGSVISDLQALEDWE